MIQNQTPVVEKGGIGGQQNGTTAGSIVCNAGVATSIASGPFTVPNSGRYKIEWLLNCTVQLGAAAPTALQVQVKLWKSDIHGVLVDATPWNAGAYNIPVGLLVNNALLVLQGTTLNAPYDHGPTGSPTDPAVIYPGGLALGRDLHDVGVATLFGGQFYAVQLLLQPTGQAVTYVGGGSFSSRVWRFPDFTLIVPIVNGGGSFIGVAYQ